MVRVYGCNVEDLLDMCHCKHRCVCGAICDEYAAKDSRIKVIHKENGGLSDARNFRLNYVK